MDTTTQDDQQLREIQRQYLDFLDDDVGLIIFLISLNIFSLLLKILITSKFEQLTNFATSALNSLSNVFVSFLNYIIFFKLRSTLFRPMKLC